MEILGIKDNVIREAPQLSESKPAEKPRPPRVETAPPPQEFSKIDLANDEQAVLALTENLNRFMKSMDYSLQFVLDKERGRVVVKVLDGEGKVIRRIPPESLDGLAAKVGARTGVVVNETLE